MVRFSNWRDSLAAMSTEPESWIRAIAQDRDRMAFAALYREISPKIRAFLRRGGADEGLTEELTQEIMLTVWRKAHTFKPQRGSVYSWVFTIAVNAGRDAWRPRPEIFRLRPAAA